MQAHYGDAFDAGNEILGVDQRYLQAAWDSMERNFGSFEGYLSAIGIDDDVVRRVRQRLVG
jgi:protein-tyrosine phosphatase